MHRLQKHCYSREKYLDILYRAEICAVLPYFCLYLVAMATPFALLTIQIAYLTSPMPKTYFTRYNFSISCTGAKSLQFFAYFGLKFVAMATPFPPLKNQIAYLNSPTAITLLFTQKNPDVLYRTVISANLAYFCPNLVAMATLFPPLKIQTENLNSPTPKTEFYTQKLSQYLVQN